MTLWPLYSVRQEFHVYCVVSPMSYIILQDKQQLLASYAYISHLEPKTFLSCFLSLPKLI